MLWRVWKYRILGLCSFSQITSLGYVFFLRSCENEFAASEIAFSVACLF